MGEFISGWINIKTEQPEMANLYSHSTTQEKLGWKAADLEIRRKWKWTKDDSDESLVVRTSSDDPPDMAANLRAALLVRWPTRQDAIQEAIVMVAKVGGYLYLDGCTGLKSLPENLKVGGDLYLSGCTGLKSLPENLKVGGDLYLDGCTGLKSLPENLQVGGYLYLDGCTGLKSLPENLKVVGDIYMGDCKAVVPDSLKEKIR